MALFGSDKTLEEKMERTLEKAIEDMNIQPSDGLIHAGAFEVGIISQKKVSVLTIAVLVHLQKQGRQIVDMQRHVGGVGETVRSVSAVVLYK